MGMTLASEKGLMGVVVAAYNAEDTIADTIYSIKNQTDSNFICVVVDDGSIDKTKEVARKVIDGDKRFELIFQRNAGVSEARNRAVQDLNTEYFFYVDADDTIEPLFIEHMKKEMIEYPGYDAYSANAMLEDAEGSFAFYQVNEPKEISFQEICRTCCLTGGGTIINRNIFLKLHGFKKQCHAEDYDFWLRFFAHRNKAIVFPEVLYHYNLVASPVRRTEDYRSGILCAYDSLLDLLDIEGLSGSEKKFIQESAENKLILLRTAEMHNAMREQRQLIRNKFAKIFGNAIADGTVKILSMFGPIVRSLRVWFALRKMDDK